ncbi:MAG TPA: hypothetical protein VEF55_09240 [Candidatus Binatia bacterium]|nr:hypothetical protein [Candidatus Binatia bacterium]
MQSPSGALQIGRLTQRHGASHIWLMEAIGVLAVVVGIVCLILITAVSLRGP